MEYLLLKRSNNKCKISFNKSKNYIKDKSEFKKYDSLINKYKQNYKEFDEKDRKRIGQLLKNLPQDTAINLLTSDKHNTVEILLENNGKTVITKYGSPSPEKRKTGKYKNIISINVGKDKYLSMLKNSTCIKEENLRKYNIEKLMICYKHLEENGNYLFKIENYCTNESIDLIYLCLCLFNEIVIFNGFYICCREFNPLIGSNDLEKLIKKDFIINDKEGLLNLEKYLQKSIKFNNHILELIIGLKLDELYEIFYMEYYKFISSNPDDIIDKGCVDEILIYLNHFFVSKLKRSFNKNNGGLKKIKAGIGEKEGKYLKKILKPKNIKKCMEIGLAMGISSLNILSAIYKHGGTLVSIDPNQSGKWNNMGKKLVENAGLGKYHTIIEDKSYNAMPELLKKEAGTYDFIFIDGWHTFDYTLIDFFYADKLLKIGGIIVVDDALHEGVKKTLKYIDTNYVDYYKRIKSEPTFGAYKKIKEDPRPWDYHENF